jgi:hypothetical protein
MIRFIFGFLRGFSTVAFSPLLLRVLQQDAHFHRTAGTFHVAIIALGNGLMEIGYRIIKAMDAGGSPASAYRRCHALAEFIKILLLAVQTGHAHAELSVVSQCGRMKRQPAWIRMRGWRQHRRS